MKSTLRRKGEHMITVRPRFDLDGDTITRMVARQCWDEASDFGDAEEPATLSRRQTEQAVVGYLQSFGWSELDDWAQNLAYEEETQERAWAWAREQVLRVWPQLTVSPDKP